jgi:hypothetical protein
MPNYLLAYRGGNMPESESEMQAGLAKWGEWYGQLGANAIDTGAPFGPSKSVDPSGATTDGAPSQLSGYSVISADTIDGAVAAAKMCPVLEIGGSIDVYETFSMM